MIIHHSCEYLEFTISNFYIAYTVKYTKFLLFRLNLHNPLTLMWRLGVKKSQLAFCIIDKFLRGVGLSHFMTFPNKKLGCRRETVRQLHTSFSARSLIVHFTSVVQLAKLVSTLSANKPCDIRTLS